MIKKKWINYFNFDGTNLNFLTFFSASVLNGSVPCCSNVPLGFKIHKCSGDIEFHKQHGNHSANPTSNNRKIISYLQNVIKYNINLTQFLKIKTHIHVTRINRNFFFPKFSKRFGYKECNDNCHYNCLAEQSESRVINLNEIYVCFLCFRWNFTYFLRNIEVMSELTAYFEKHFNTVNEEKN